MLSFWFPQGFWENYFPSKMLHYAFYVWFIEITPKLILHEIIDV